VSTQASGQKARIEELTRRSQRAQSLVCDIESLAEVDSWTSFESLEYNLRKTAALAGVAVLQQQMQAELESILGVSNEEQP